VVHPRLLGAIDSSEVTGLLLAGGLGQRMGGADKGLVTLDQLDGRPMASWILERLRPQVACIIINANRHQEQWRTFGERVISDRMEGFLGPLAGMHAGLQCCSTPWLVTVPCDSPFLPLDLVERLVTGAESASAEVAVARTDDRLQPAFALMRRELGHRLEDYLQGGGRSLTGWFDSVNGVVVEFSDSDAFANFNTPAELYNAHRPK
jgi:molybdopterin-guanine dinucleotide biosynthesis protein A